MKISPAGRIVAYIIVALSIAGVAVCVTVPNSYPVHNRCDQILPALDWEPNNHAPCKEGDALGEPQRDSLIAVAFVPTLLAALFFLVRRRPVTRTEYLGVGGVVIVLGIVGFLLGAPDLVAIFQRYVMHWGHWLRLGLWAAIAALYIWAPAINNHSFKQQPP
jgi:hypothetical protein